MNFDIQFFLYIKPLDQPQKYGLKLNLVLKRGIVISKVQCLVPLMVGLKIDGSLKRRVLESQEPVHLYIH